MKSTKSSLAKLAIAVLPVKKILQNRGAALKWQHWTLFFYFHLLILQYTPETEMC